MCWDEAASETGVLRALLPERGVAFAFAYGSSVFAQPDYSSSAQRPMLDLVVAVDDPASWHSRNCARNSAHYSGLMRVSGARDTVQGWGAGVFFNPMVEGPEGRLVKYGVVGVDALQRDLLEWDALYLAGRLHKPVRVLKRPAEGSPLREALRVNLVAAMAAALLLVGGDDERDLYETVCGLSYAGDVRMGLGDHPSKVGSIARGARPELERLYAPAARELAGLPREELALRLPPALRHRAQRGELRAAMAAVVRRSSRAQTLKGVVTAGLARSAVYAARKVSKAWR